MFPSLSILFDPINGGLSHDHVLNKMSILNQSMGHNTVIIPIAFKGQSYKHICFFTYCKIFSCFISIDNIIHESSMYLYFQSCCLWENVFFFLSYKHMISLKITPIFDTWQVWSSWQNPRLFYREDILTSERKLNDEEWNAENWTFIDIHGLYTSYSVVKKKKHQSILFFSTSNQL